MVGRIWLIPQIHIVSPKPVTNFMILKLRSIYGNQIANLKEF